MTIFPDRFHQKKTLLGALMYYLGKDADSITENLIVHRLDKGTSGVLIVAKNKAAGDFLKEQFKKRKVEKKYLACVIGQIQPPQAIIEAEIGRNPHQPFKMAVVPDGEGKKAITYYSVIKYFDNFTFLEVWPKTGRTHQIRVHFASIGYPIAGDNVYGSKNILFNLKRPFLHAAMLKITHPKTKTKMTFESPLPNDLKQFLKSIENSN
jgi:23S rRNA pseudouridine1911/1915/1917 synthase